MASRGLSARQRIFVNAFVKTGNASESARQAGYSKKASGTMGARLCKNIHVKAEIEKYFKRSAAKAELSKQDVLNELRLIAFSKAKGAFDENGNMLSVHEMPEDIQAAIASVETEELFTGKYNKKRKVGVARRIRFNDKIRALDLLGKHFKLFTDVQEISGPNGGPQVVLQTFVNGTEAKQESEKSSQFDPSKIKVAVDESNTKD